MVAQLYQPVEAALFKAHVLEEHLLVLRVELGDFLLGLGADDQHLRTLGLGDCTHLLHQRQRAFILAHVALGDVGGVNDFFHRQQKPALGHFQQLFGKGGGAGGLALVHVGKKDIGALQLVLKLLFAVAHQMRGLFAAAGDGFDIGENQLGLDGVDIAGGIDAAIHMDDVFILKAAHHMDDGVHLADVGEELVAQALAVARALDQAGDVHEFQRGRGVFFGVVHLREHVQPFVRHGDHAGVRLDGAKRVIRRLRARAGDGVKQRALADVRQTDNAQFHLYAHLLQTDRADKASQAAGRIYRSGMGKLVIAVRL